MRATQHAHVIFRCRAAQLVSGSHDDDDDDDDELTIAVADLGCRGGKLRNV